MTQILELKPGWSYELDDVASAYLSRVLKQGLNALSAIDKEKLKERLYPYAMPVNEEALPVLSWSHFTRIFPEFEPDPEGEVFVESITINGVKFKFRIPELTEISK